MECPMSFNDSAGSIHCKQKDCAWWNKITNRCAILSFAEDLTTIKDILNDIENSNSLDVPVRK